MHKGTSQFDNSTGLCNWGYHCFRIITIISSVRHHRIIFSCYVQEKIDTAYVLDCLKCTNLISLFEDLMISFGLVGWSF